MLSCERPMALGSQHVGLGLRWVSSPRTVKREDTRFAVLSGILDEEPRAEEDFNEATRTS